MEIMEKRIENLKILTIPHQHISASNGLALILGNAYGIMPYQTPLAQMLAERGIEPWWFAFSGQAGTEGTYSLQSGVQNIKIAYDYLSNLGGDKPLYIIAHCASSIMTLEFLNQNPFNHVEKLIIYGLLFRPSRRKNIALKKFKEYGINETISESDWSYNPLEAISNIQIPILFCHAKDKLNLFRAREEEMERVVGVAKNAEIKWFDKGYDNDLEPLPDYADCYYSFLTLQSREMIAAEVA